MNDTTDLERAGAGFLSTLFEKINLDIEVSIMNAREGWHTFELSGNTEDLKGRPELISAITLLTSQVVSRAGGSAAHCLLDFDGAFEAREEQLSTLAEDLARAVLRNGRLAVLDSLSSSERRVVHLHLKGHEQVQTRSQDAGSRRLLVVEPLPES